jgi:cytidylate kinase
MIIAIDGPAGSGKTTVGGQLAERLGFPFLVSGTLYRAATWEVLQSGIPWDDRRAIETRIRALDLRTTWSPRGLRAEVGKRDVTAEIFGPEVTREIHRIADDAQYRALILERQRAFAEGGNLVAEGRDMGTVVFPDADFKFFLVAPDRERALRRWRELRVRIPDLPLETVEEEIRVRDERDRSRDVSPLRAAADAHILETGERTAEEVVQAIVEVVRGGR